MTSDVVLVDRSGAVARVTLNRPARLNALDGEMIDRLLTVLADLDADPVVRALVLTGAGRGFCAGADVGDIARAAGEDAARSVSDVRRMIRTGSERLAMALLELETPVVAAVNGPCAGAGVGIALCADFLVARSDARFSVAFTRRGLVPDYATTFLLPRVVGLRQARRLALLGETITAQDAAEAGLVHEVVEEAEFDGAVDALARRLAEGPTLALGLTRRLLLTSFEVDGHAAVNREFTAQALCFASDDAREGASAFLEKRDPRFTGR